MSYVLQTRNLEKIINGKKILSNLNIHLMKGGIYGFLGPNGAGKTTVMKMILNLWKPSGGSIELFGENVLPKSYEMLRRIGNIIEFPVFYEHLSGESNLYLHCKYMGHGNQRSVENAIDLLELTEVSKRPVKEYSLGMKQRLGIARAILTKPELLVLDEPTNGLDPIGMKQVKNLLCMLREELGVTIMVSTHILSEIEDIADTIGIINHGKLLEEISMKDISQMNTSYIDVGVQDIQKTAQVLSDMLREDRFKIVDGNNIRIYSNTVTTQEIAEVFLYKNIDFFSIGKKTENLEDYFIRLLGEGERGA